MKYNIKNNNAYIYIFEVSPVISTPETLFTPGVQNKFTRIPNRTELTNTKTLKHTHTNLYTLLRVLMFK